MRDEQRRKESNRWLLQARRDLHAAVNGRGIAGEQRCFLAQQASEKAINAVLIGEGIEFPFTHDLERNETLDRPHLRRDR